MKPLLVTLFFCVITASAFAESDNLADDASTLAQMEIVKKQIIERALDLTPDQCDAFWPLYDAYQQEMRDLWGRQSRLSFAFTHQQEFISEDAVREMVAAYLRIENAQVALRRSTLRKFSQVMSASTLMRFLQVEKQIESDFYGVLSKYSSVTQ